jgi:hypothetical protein
MKSMKNRKNPEGSYSTSTSLTAKDNINGKVKFGGGAINTLITN